MGQTVNLGQAVLPPVAHMLAEMVSASREREGYLGGECLKRRERCRPSPASLGCSAILVTHLLTQSLNFRLLRHCTISMS